MSSTACARIDLDSVTTDLSERRGLPDQGSSCTANASDGQLIESVKLALYATGHASLRKLEIEICHDVVVLWGQVPTYYQKQLAQVAALRVDGVRGIANGLEVICTQRDWSQTCLP